MRLAGDNLVDQIPYAVMNKTALAGQVKEAHRFLFMYKFQEI